MWCEIANCVSAESDVTPSNAISATGSTHEHSRRVLDLIRGARLASWLQINVGCWKYFVTRKPRFKKKWIDRCHEMNLTKLDEIKSGRSRNWQYFFHFPRESPTVYAWLITCFQVIRTCFLFVLILWSRRLRHRLGVGGRWTVIVVP